jgi:transcriptional pleiotropic regulator of transition state genes
MNKPKLARKLDELGRVVIPVEIRRSLGLCEGEKVEFCFDKDRLYIQKASNTCLVTGEDDEANISLLDGKITVSKRGVEVLLRELTTAKGAIQ